VRALVRDQLLQLLYDESNAFSQNIDSNIMTNQGEDLPWYMRCKRFPINYAPAVY
jgi:hypothetical protein